MQSHVRYVKLYLAALLLGLFATAPARAADGCKFLLCIAGNWNQIQECRPTVRKVFRDVARGHPFPSCDMSGDDNQAHNARTTEPTCPPMYRQYNAESGAYESCTYRRRVTVVINGVVWSHVYWNTNGDTVTWYSDAARQQLSQTSGDVQASPLDETFNNDLTAWNDSHTATCTASGGTPVMSDFESMPMYESCQMPVVPGADGA